MSVRASRYHRWSMNIFQALTSEKQFYARDGDRTAAHTFVRARAFVIWVNVAHWLERFTSHQKATGSIRVWDSEIVFPRLGLEERLSIIKPIVVHSTEVHDSCCEAKVPELVFPEHNRLRINKGFVHNAFPAVETVSWFWRIFESTSFKLSSWLNAERISVADELADLERPVYYSTSKQQSS